MHSISIKLMQSCSSSSDLFLCATVNSQCFEYRCDIIPLTFSLKWLNENHWLVLIAFMEKHPGFM